MLANVPTVGLSNGVELPLLGLGTWLATEPESFKIALRTALNVGYRYFDTATRYKNEYLIGEVLQEYYDDGKFKRSDIFITSKLPFYGHSNPEYYLKKSLNDLKTDYLDLYLMHTPLPTKPNPETKFELYDEDDKLVVDTSIPLNQTWQQMENFYEKKMVRSIGLSNFNAKQLQEIYNEAKIKPQNLQVELTIVLQQTKLIKLCRKLNIAITSYGTLGSPGSVEFRGEMVEGSDCLGHPLVKELSKKYNKTPAQILLRNFTQRQISVIPKSTNPKRVKENIQIFDFEISAEDLKRLDETNRDIRLFKFNFLKHHPWYPFV